MKITEVNKYRDFLALEKTWKNVLERCSQHTVFSTWEWLTTWWKHFGNDKKLLLLLAEENGDTIGLAPLMYAVHTILGFRLGKIEFLGVPDSDYDEFLLEQKDSECIELFLEYLKRSTRKWSCIELADIPQNAEFLPALAKFSKVLEPHHLCPHINLPKSYDTFLKALGSKQRKHLRYNSNLIKRSFSMEFLDCSKGGAVAESMETFFELHQRRWTSLGYPGVFADQKTRAFHLDIAKSFSERGWLGLFLLKLSGTPVAAHYGFKYHGRFFSYLSGFDPRYSKVAVGSILISRIIEQCIEEGLSDFDFMRGAEDYKNRWNTISKWNQKAIITREGVFQSIRYRLDDAFWRQGIRLKYVINHAPRTLAHALNKRQNANEKKQRARDR